MPQQASWTLIRRIIRFVVPYKRVALLSFLAMICTAALEPVLPALMQPLIDKSLIDKNPTALWQVPVFIVLAFVVKGLADYVANVSSQYLAQRVMADLRSAVFDHQMALPVGRHQAEEGGRMLSRITFDIAQMGEAIATAWLTVIKDSLVLVGLVGFLFYLSLPLALLVFAMAPILAWAIRRASGRLRSSNRAVQGFIGRLTGFVEESLAGLKEIKIFGAQGRQMGAFDDLNTQLRREQMRVVRVQAINVPMVQVLAACSVALVIYVAGWLSQDNRLSPGEFVSFITAMSMVFEPVRRLTNVNAVLQKGLAAAESVFGLLDERAEEGRPGSQSMQPSSSASPYGGTSVPQRIRGEVEFKSVSFAYPGRESVLRDFNLRINARESVALVGPSGSGKTTVFHLLAGFATPDAGQVLVDGRPVDDIGLQALRSNLAVVGQQVVLFQGSVRDNILMGRPDASEGQVRAAAQAAHAWDFIAQLQQGLDTQIGSMGSALSGGQRQRIAIARAFLKDAPILLLDEATSALDKESEEAVLAGLKNLMTDRTVLFISHTPERLLHVDRVVKMGNGGAG